MKSKVINEWLWRRNKGKRLEWISLAPTWSRAGEREREEINWLSGRYSGKNIKPLEDKKLIFVC